MSVRGPASVTAVLALVVTVLLAVFASPALAVGDGAQAATSSRTSVPVTGDVLVLPEVVSDDGVRFATTRHERVGASLAFTIPLLDDGQYVVEWSDSSGAHQRALPIGTGTARTPLNLPGDHSGAVPALLVVLAVVLVLLAGACLAFGRRRLAVALLFGCIAALGGVAVVVLSDESTVVSLDECASLERGRSDCLASHLVLEYELGGVKRLHGTLTRLDSDPRFAEVAGSYVCHGAAHRVSHVLVSRGLSPQVLLDGYDGSCGMALMHGAVEAFAWSGSPVQVASVCDYARSVSRERPRLLEQCTHGLGNGAAHRAGGNAKDAFALCLDAFTDEADRASCVEGVGYTVSARITALWGSNLPTDELFTDESRTMPAQECLGFTGEVQARCFDTMMWYLDPAITDAGQRGFAPEALMPGVVAWCEGLRDYRTVNRCLHGVGAGLAPPTPSSDVMNLPDLCSPASTPVGRVACAAGGVWRLVGHAVPIPSVQTRERMCAQLGAGSWCPPALDAANVHELPDLLARADAQA